MRGFRDGEPRLRGLIKSPNDGFGLSASSLVGPERGTHDEETAEAYGWDIFRFSITRHVLTGAFVAVFAGPIAHLFLRDPAAVAATVPLIRVVTVAAVGIGIDGAATGTLRAVGTRVGRCMDVSSAATVRFRSPISVR